MAGRPKKTTDAVVAEKPKKTGVPKMPNPPPLPTKTDYSSPDYVTPVMTLNEDLTEEQKAEIRSEFENEGEIKPLDETLVEDNIIQPETKENGLVPYSEAIVAIYEHLCTIPSDINQLLPLIREVASHCEHCTEMGVRDPTSTWAILAGNPKKLVSYDIVRHENVSKVKALAYNNFEFILGNSLEVDIEETDFLLIDTHHKYQQLKVELGTHGKKVRKYILMHDSISFGNRDESEYEDQPQKVYQNGPGLMPAINEFLSEGNFVVDFHATYNNGLMILRRVR